MSEDEALTFDEIAEKVKRITDETRKENPANKGLILFAEALEKYTLVMTKTMKTYTGLE